MSWIATGLCLLALCLWLNLAPPPQLLTSAISIPSPTWFFYADNSPLNRPEILRTVCIWTRLQPLPKSARHIHISSGGDTFTKRYRVTFDAPADDINAWLKASPGTQDQSPTHLENGTRTFAISPRDAAFAELTLTTAGEGDRANTAQETVEIWTYWH